MDDTKYAVPKLHQRFKLFLFFAVAHTLNYPYYYRLKSYVSDEVYIYNLCICVLYN